MFPVVVLSTNQDVRAVQSEVIKRAVVVHAEASTPVAMSSKNNLITRIGKQFSTALYRRYLSRMLEEWPTFMSGFHGHDPAGSTHEAPDLVMLSSTVLRRTIAEALGEVPPWCTPVDINLLGAMSGRKIKDRMRSQWRYKRNSF
jgi:hypothetical protein